MHAGTAIDVRWIFVCEEQNLHARLGRCSGACVKRRISKQALAAANAPALTSRAPAAPAHRPRGELCLQSRRRECH
jgi:hypothetical protein